MNIKRILSAASASVFMALAIPAAAFAVTPTTVYDATPNPLPPNVASLGFQATQTSEFGDYVHLGGTDRNLNTVTVTMSDWALFSDYSSNATYSGNSASWTHPITLNIYNAIPGTPNQVGSPLGSVTQTVTIPWRPEADTTCAGGTAWRASDGQCYNGKAFNATFDMSSLGVTLPNAVIVSVAYDTQSYGAHPTGVAGPYNSLNVGVPTGQTATVGSDDSSSKVFWNSSTGTGGVFVEDSGWAPNGTVAFKVTASAALAAAPTNKDQCKDNLWKNFNNPSFKNQGDCVSFVASGGKAKGNPKEDTSVVNTITTALNRLF